MDGLTRRKKAKEEDSNQSEDRRDHNGSKSKSGRNAFVGLFVVVLATGLSYHSFNQQQSVNDHISTKAATESSRSKNGNDKEFKIDNKVNLQLYLNHSSDRQITLGPHNVRVSFEGNCENPSMYLRLTGDALVHVPLEEDFTGTFYMPVEGNYQLEVPWYVCNNEVMFTSLPESISFDAKDTGSEPAMASSKSSLSLFPTGFWFSKERFPEEQKSNIKSAYVWVPLDQRNSSPPTDFLNAASNLGEATTFREANPIPSAFSQLSNYEVVCFVGSPSSAGVYLETFLSLRPQIANSQRPFKFHHYAVTDFTNVDQHWTKRRMSRKCKHTLVSVDELDVAISQADYKEKMMEFLQGVVKCLHDESFIVWVFTVNQIIPSKANNLCHSPAKQTRNHPCNDALFEIFEEKKLPEWVKLLDNTDLAHAQPPTKDLVATIAMRIFALIGDKVAKWRAVGQSGRVDGLHRNGKIENDPAEECFVQ